jgi:hypothetical protein
MSHTNTFDAIFIEHRPSPVTKMSALSDLSLPFINGMCPDRLGPQEWYKMELDNTVRSPAEHIAVTCNRVAGRYARCRQARSGW